MEALMQLLICRRYCMPSLEFPRDRKEEEETP